MSAVNHRRRSFLLGRGADAPTPVRPPWSTDESIDNACIRCGACHDACPQLIIRLGDGGLPEIDFAAGECTFCGACVQACPEPVFDSVESPAFTHVATIRSGCFARNGIHCQSCAEVCPEGAILFRYRRGGPPLPEIDANRCTGCGTCIGTCPADAIAPIEGRTEGLDV